MIYNHDILIAALYTDREPPCVVCVELANMLYTEMHFAELFRCRVDRNSLTLGLRWFGGRRDMYSLTLG